MLQFKPYTCTMCGTYFHCFDRIKQHINRHKMTNRYSVSSCLKVLPHQIHLKRHGFYTRKKEIPYQCKYCQKCSSRQYDLNVHIRTHTKGKPYQCEYCQKWVSKLSYLMKHIRIRVLSEKFFSAIYTERAHQNSELTLKRNHTHVNSVRNVFHSNLT